MNRYISWNKTYKCALEQLTQENDKADARLFPVDFVFNNTSMMFSDLIWSCANQLFLTEISTVQKWSRIVQLKGSYKNHLPLLPTSILQKKFLTAQIFVLNKLGGQSSAKPSFDSAHCGCWKSIWILLWRAISGLIKFVFAPENHFMASGFCCS